MSKFDGSDAASLKEGINQLFDRFLKLGAKKYEKYLVSSTADWSLNQN